MHQTSSSPQLEQARDPVAAIAAIQRSQQRFWRGYPVTLVLAVLLVPVWMFTFALVEPASKMRIIAAALGGALVALPLRFLGRVSELRLAVWGGVAAALAIWLGDFLAQALTSSGAPLSLVPRGRWWESLVTYAATGWLATSAGRKALAIELSKPSAQAGAVTLSAPQVWEDPNAIVLEGPASIFRGWIAVPGKLKLSSQQLQFIDKRSDTPAPVVALADVTVVEQSSHGNAFNLTLRDGTTYRFVVFNRDEWIVHVNSRLSAARAMSHSTPSGRP